MEDDPGHTAHDDSDPGPQSYCNDEDGMYLNDLDLSPRAK